MLHPKHSLSVVYYIVLLLAVLSAMLGYYVVYQYQFVLDKASVEAVNLYTIILCYIIITLPISFAFFSWKLNKIKNIEDIERKKVVYVRLSILRMAIIALGLISAIFCYYITQQMSLFWLAGIEAIATIICKPTERKISADLGLENYN